MALHAHGARGSKSDISLALLFITSQGKEKGTADDDLSVHT